jgi:hypothetical protein
VHLLQATLDKDLQRVNANLAALPSSPTAAQASKEGIDLLAATVWHAVPHSDCSSRRHCTLEWLLGSLLLSRQRW